ncbi:hypothetical protein pEaSNUABM40_00197 [Erwinia phage pEa_SNUABM_40]|nr:hypothetical protein pEaSNUABM40_00197 [Erwinia phage pEa_SNUABM_40]
MALIKINIADNLLSESAAKKSVYKMAKVGGASTLVVATESKPELQAVVGLLKKAKTAAISGMSARIKAATAFTKAGQTPKGPRKTALRETYKTEKAKSSADIKQAKALIKEANAHAKKHHLGGLNLPLSASDLVLSGPGLAKALKAVRAIKLTEFGVTGKRGMFKPKFMREDKFSEIGAKGDKKTGKAATTTKKRAADTKATKTPTKKAGAKSLDDMLKGNSDKERPMAGKVPLDSYTTSRVPGTKVSIDAHDHAPASKDISNIVKSLIEKGGVDKGKFRVKGNSIEYKLGTASYRMSKNPKTGKWDSFANFGGNGGGSVPGSSLQSARKGLEASIKRLQKFKKVDRMAAQNSWMKGGK